MPASTGSPFVGTQLNRLAILPDGVNHVARGLEGVGEREVQVRIGGAQPHRGAEFIDPLIELPGLGERHPEPRVGVGVLGEQA